MLKNRVIAVVILRDGQVVQSVNFNHTNVIHYDAIHAIENFNRWNVDEIVLLNVDRENNGKDRFLDVLNHVSKSCFVPLSVGGWVDEEDYAVELIASGADKLVLNSTLITSPNLVSSLSTRLGSQCLIASIDVKQEEGQHRVYYDRGRLKTPMSLELAIDHAEKLGCGEIFLNNIDFDGARKGYDLDMIRKASEVSTVPIIAFGGVFKWQHMVDGIDSGADAVAAANIFHYTEHATKKAKRFLHKNNIPIRMEGI